MKFDAILNDYKKLYEADAPTAETPPTGAPPEEAPPETPEEAPPEETPEEPVDVDGLVIEFTNLILKALDFGRKYPRNTEIDNLIASRPYTKEDAMTTLDKVNQMMQSNIDPTTSYRFPGTR